MRGHLRQRAGRPKDCWEIEVDNGRDPVTGRRRRVMHSVRGTRRQAEQALNELINDVNKGQAKGTTSTLGDLVTHWLDHVGGDLSPKTLVEYKRVVDVRILPASGGRSCGGCWRRTSTPTTSACCVRALHRRRYGRCTTSSAPPLANASGGGG